MSLTTYPRQDLFESTLLADISSGDVSITVNDAPSFTLTAGQSCYLHVDYDVTAKYEPMLITAISGATLTVTRGIARYEGGGSSATTHSAGANVRMSVGWMDFSQIKDELANKLDSTDGVCTTPLQDTVYASLAALQAAIPTPANGRSAYCTLEGQPYDSAGGAWVARATGTNPNWSATVAGKAERATTAEIDADTETGGTGAALGINPSDLATSKYGTRLPSAAEKTLLGGITADAAELNKLDGTSANVTATNLNTLHDGISTPIATLHAHKKTNGAFTWDLSSSKQVAHGLGATPNWVRATGKTNSTTSFASSSSGSKVGTSYACLYHVVNAGPTYATGVSTSALLVLTSAAGGANVNITVTMDGTNLTFATGSDFGDCVIEWECGV